MPPQNKIKKIIVYLSLYLVTSGIIASVFLLRPVEQYNFSILRMVIVFFASVLLTKYFVYMFLSPWYDVTVAYKKRKSRMIEVGKPNIIKKRSSKYDGVLKKESAEDVGKIYFNPRVSVLIPAWNEETGILDTIGTLLKSSYTNLELVVVNDGSTDNSDELIKKFVENYNKKQKKSTGIDIVYHYKQNGGKGSALNTAIELSTGEILMSIDADCVVMPDTIKNFVWYFTDPKVYAAVGNVKVGDTKNILGVIQYLEFLFSFYFKKADSLMNAIYIIGGAAGAFRREVFDIIGNYSTKNITEDIDLSVRIQDAGLKIVYASDALVYTEGASEIKGLMKQRLRWKRGRFETFIDNRHMFFSSEKHHNKILTWVILPLSYFGELQLSLEIGFLMFLYVYSFLTSDFSSFISGVVVVSSMFFVQMFFDDKRTKSFSFYILAPIGWLLFYVSTFVEFNALFKSLYGLFRKQELKWQKWQRKGVMGETVQKIG
jgi:poly-beta-1,6-N-acetyl-D-glucosamine synthase